VGSTRKNVPHLTPAEVVQRFCQLDAEGTRLNGTTLANITPLIGWTDMGGDVVFVIESFKIGKASINGSSAIVLVEHEMLGSTSFIDEFSEKLKGKHTTTFKLFKEGGLWKIYAPVTAPHIYWKTAIAHIRDITGSEPVRNEQLKGIIRKILKARDRYERKR
jgi:hypothetical protein